MAIDNRTTGRNYPLPHPSNLLAEDVQRLRDALNAIDADVVQLDQLIEDVIGGAPGALDTLNELAAALGDDANFAATVTTALNNRYTKAESDARYVQGVTLSFAQAGAGAVTRTLESKLRDVVSAADFGAIGDGSLSTSAMLSAVTAAWNAALAAGKDLFFPAGIYAIGNANFPWRQAVIGPTTLLDCKNITIYGEGPSTVFKTVSPGGADVFQLNGVKNLHFRNLAITAELTGFADAGSSGISITGGFDNITAHDVYIYDLPSLDKTTYADGGKALTLQLADNDNLCGSLSARITVKNCLQGFGFEPYLHRLQGQPCSIKVQMQAEKCFQGVVYSAPAATSALTSGFSSGVQIDAILVNCQKDVVLARAHGCDIRATVVSTQTKAERTKDSAGVTWLASDTVVESLVSLYSHNCQVRISGYKGNTDYKARIGGTAQGSSGLIGATLNGDFYLDLAGTAALADVATIDAGGNTMAGSRLVCTAATTGSLPSDFYLAVNKNDVLLEEKHYAPSGGAIKFPATQISSADAKVLDDYEEGSWVPSFSNSLGGSVTFTLNRARYVKIGSQVNCWFSATRNDATAMNGAVTWTLPFPSIESANWASVGTYWATGKSQGIVVIDNFANNIANGCESTSGGTNTYLNYIVLANGSNLTASFTYLTDT
jgi:hypothetical protein